MPSDRTGPQGAPRYSPAQRRLLRVTAGLAVAALTGGAFVLTYDVLRDLALAGGASRRWAPVHPAMSDLLIALTLLSLAIGRQARWWTRWLRWALLLALVAGTATASVQHAVWGFDSLPDDALKAGVAVAPLVLLVLAVWLWLTVIRQLRAPLPAAGRTVEPGLQWQREHVKTLKPLPLGAGRPDPEDAAEAATVRALPPALLPTDVELVRTGTTAGEHEPGEHEPEEGEGAWAGDESAAAAETGGPREGDQGMTTRPDLVRPLTLDDEGTLPAPYEHDGDGDGDPDELPIWGWDPPSGNLRSSPVPPAE